MDRRHQGGGGVDGRHHGGGGVVLHVNYMTHQFEV